MTKKKDIDYVHIESVSTWCGAVRACDVVPELTALVSPIFPILPILLPQSPPPKGCSSFQPCCRKRERQRADLPRSLSPLRKSKQPFWVCVCVCVVNETFLSQRQAYLHGGCCWR